MSCPYIFPSASWCPGNYIQEGVGQVTVVIEGVVSTAECDVAEIPAWQRVQRRAGVSKCQTVFMKEESKKQK